MSRYGITINYTESADSRIKELMEMNLGSDYLKVSDEFYLTKSDKANPVLVILDFKRLHDVISDIKDYIENAVLLRIEESSDLMPILK